MKGWKFKDYLACAIGMAIIGYLLISLLRIIIGPHQNIDHASAARSVIREIIEEYLEENNLEVDEVTLWEIVEDCYEGGHYVDNENIGFFVREEYLQTIKITINICRIKIIGYLCCAK